jgi:hypothetical protein
VFSPADVVNNNLLISICTFLNCNWNLWGGPEARHLCRLGDLILDVYVQPEVTIDLTTDEHSNTRSGSCWMSYTRMILPSQSLRSLRMRPLTCYWTSMHFIFSHSYQGFS